MTPKRYKPMYYTVIPNEVIDELMAGLTGAEFKVLCYIFRRTFGFHREATTVSIRHICSGLVTKDGKRLDNGTGLSRNATIDAVAELEKRGLIIVRRRKAVDGQHLSNTYTILMQTDDGAVGGDGLPEVLETTPAHGVKQSREFTYTEAGNEVVQKSHYVVQSANQVVQTTHHLNKERKKVFGNKAPYMSPLQQSPAILGCQGCGGYGVIATDGTAVEHDGTLDGVKYCLSGQWGVPSQLCSCVIGRGWETLIQDSEIPVQRRGMAK